MKEFADNSLLMCFSSYGGGGIYENYTPARSMLYEVSVSGFVDDNSYEFFSSLIITELHSNNNSQVVSGSSRNTGRGFVILEKGRVYSFWLKYSGSPGITSTSSALLIPVKVLYAP